MSRYRFARRPWWIASHILVLALVAVMVWAGFWQLRRYDERRQLNRLYGDRQAAPVADLDAVVDPDRASADEATFRRVTATGTYDVDGEVLVRNRTQGGRPGVWILTPLALGDGTAVVVNRGFVPGSGLPEIPAEAAAPDGEVTITGLAQPTQERGRFGPTDPDTGSLEVISRVDLARLQEQIDDDLYPVWLILENQTPPVEAEVPIPVSPPEPFSETRHLSYAFQWFAFTAIALAGYPFILRRQARTEERKRRRPADDDSVPAAHVPVAVSPNGRRALDVPVTDRPSSSS
jgi:cytochrome oxidase assembly protein ShyY1